MLRNLFSFVVVSVFFFAIAGSATVQAQNSGFQISPTRTTINANPGETKKFSLDVKNVSDKTVSVSISYSNFTNSDDESGEPKIVTGQIPYGLAPWLSNPKFLPSISRGKSASIPITISVPSDAKAGTYYGLVRIADATPGSSLQASVGSLVFLNVGQIEQTVEVEEFKLIDNTFLVRLKNTGNGFIVPSVALEISNASDNSVVDTVDANPAAGGIISGTIRKYSLPVPKGVDPAKQYKVRLTVLASESSAPVTKELTLGKPEPAPAAPVQDKKGPNLILIIPLILLSVLIIVILAVVLLLKRRRKNNKVPFAPIATIPNSFVSPPPPPQLTAPSPPAASKNQNSGPPDLTI